METALGEMYKFSFVVLETMLSEKPPKNTKIKTVITYIACNHTYN